MAFGSFPSPAVFEWPRQIVLTSSTVITDDVTLVDVTTHAETDVTYKVIGRNGHNGALSRTISIQIRVKGTFSRSVMFCGLLGCDTNNKQILKT